MAHNLPDDLMKTILLGYELHIEDIDHLLRAVEGRRKEKIFKPTDAQEEQFLDACMLILMGLKAAKTKLKAPYKALLRKFPTLEEELETMLDQRDNKMTNINMVQTIEVDHDSENTHKEENSDTS